MAVAGQTLSLDGRTAAVNPFFLAPLSGGQASVSVPLLALLLSAAGVCAYLLFKPRRARAARTWDCGYYRLDSRNEYTATAQSKPFGIAFSFFLLPYRRTQKIRESFYHFKSFVYETHTTPVFRKYLYRPLAAGIFRTASSMKRLQAGSIHLYIGYIFVTLVALLIFLRAF
jgi:hydrogenase-4 component B